MLYKILIAIRNVFNRRRVKAKIRDYETLFNKNCLSIEEVRRLQGRGVL